MINRRRFFRAALAMIGALAGRAGTLHPIGTMPLLPSSDGVVNLAEAEAPKESESPPNPFRTRWHPPPVLKEETLPVTGILIAGAPGRPCACIDGQLCSPGESTGGLVVDSIRDDGIECRHTRFRLILPFGENALRLIVTH